MEDFERKERRERDKQARAMMAQEKHQEPVPLFGEPVRVSFLLNYFTSVNEFYYKRNFVRSRVPVTAIVAFNQN